MYAASGNPGISALAQCQPDLDILDHRAVANFVETNGIEFTIVGSESPLAVGIVDYFTEQRNLPIFGPTRAAAEIETSKAFCSALLQGAGVPIPDTTYYESFSQMRDAVADTSGGIVLKYVGLAAGKGAIVVNTNAELPAALASLKKLGPEGFIVQEKEDGPEVSLFYLVDGADVLFLGSAADYKPLYVGGPNTGGMGGFAPHPLLTPVLRKTIEETIVRPTIAAMFNVNREYRGVMYFQLMITKRGPVVIEINCRFGDPEAQLLMPLLDCELLPLLQATTKSGFLRMMEVRRKPQMAVGIVLASEGYPDDPQVGRAIDGFRYDGSSSDPEHYAHVYHAGTKVVDDQLVTAGGRVLTTVGIAHGYRTAKNLALTAADLIGFKGKYYRTDIADAAINGVYAD
jgi:phosphoribosylamine--glycine ligase